MCGEPTDSVDSAHAVHAGARAMVKMSDKTYYERLEISDEADADGVKKVTALSL